VKARRSEPSVDGARRPPKQRRRGAVAQQVHVFDAVRPGGHPGHQAGHLEMLVHPARLAEPDMLSRQAAQASLAGPAP